MIRSRLNRAGRRGLAAQARAAEEERKLWFIEHGLAMLEHTTQQVLALTQAYRQGGLSEADYRAAVERVERRLEPLDRQLGLLP